MNENTKLRLPSKRRSPAVWGKVLGPFQVMALAFLCTLTLLAHPASSKAAETVSWDLTQGTAVQSGKAAMKGPGLLTAGHVTQAEAQSRGPAQVGAGKFTINYAVQEKAGKYILRGEWDITKEGALQTSYSPADSVQGLIYAELPFNPATSAGAIDAQVLVFPRVRQGGDAVKAVGTFKGNEKFEGTLSITKTP